MKDNTLRMALLFDVYGGLLTPRQQLIFDLYHNEDLSFGEIAENEGISRQAVSDCLEKARATLDAFEASVGFLRRREAVLECAGRLEKLPAAEMSAGQELREISEILRGEFGGL